MKAYCMYSNIPFYASEVFPELTSYNVHPFLDSSLLEVRSIFKKRGLKLNTDEKNLSSTEKVILKQELLLLTLYPLVYLNKVDTRQGGITESFYTSVSISKLQKLMHTARRLCTLLESLTEREIKRIKCEVPSLSLGNVSVSGFSDILQSVEITANIISSDTMADAGIRIPKKSILDSILHTEYGQDYIKTFTFSQNLDTLIELIESYPEQFEKDQSYYIDLLSRMNGDLNSLASTSEVNNLNSLLVKIAELADTKGIHALNHQALLNFFNTQAQKIADIYSDKMGFIEGFQMAEVTGTKVNEFEVSLVSITEVDDLDFSLSDPEVKGKVISKDGEVREIRETSKPKVNELKSLTSCVAAKSSSLKARIAANRKRREEIKK